ncbi:active regulator of SIRT1 [Rhinophrynus dorsalis]
MSTSLLRKGLELLGTERSDKKRLGSKKKNVSASGKRELLSSHKTGVKKQLSRIKQQGQQHNQRATVKGRVIKSAVEEFKKRSKNDNLQHNLKYMLGFQSVTKKDVVKKILKQNRGRISKDRQMKRQKKIEEKSVFSDADFKRFEMEYFGSR